MKSIRSFFEQFRQILIAYLYYSILLYLYEYTIEVYLDNLDRFSPCISTILSRCILMYIYYRRYNKCSRTVQTYYHHVFVLFYPTVFIYIYIYIYIYYRRYNKCSRTVQTDFTMYLQSNSSDRFSPCICTILSHCIFIYIYFRRYNKCSRTVKTYLHHVFVLFYPVVFFYIYIYIYIYIYTIEGIINVVEQLRQIFTMYLYYFILLYSLQKI